MTLLPCCSNVGFRFGLRDTSGHRRFRIADVPPQPNSPLSGLYRISANARVNSMHQLHKLRWPQASYLTSPSCGPTRQHEATSQDHGLPSCHRMSKATIPAVVFHDRCCQTYNRHPPPINYIRHVTPQRQTRVKLNRVFFPR